jgi:hypothetical protein
MPKSCSDSDQASKVLLPTDDRKWWNGKCLALLKSGKSCGNKALPDCLYCGTHTGKFASHAQHLEPFKDDSPSYQALTSAAQDGQERPKAATPALPAKGRSPELTAENLINDLPVTVTGIRPGEIVIGYRCTAIGGAIEIKTDKIYPPGKKQLDMIWSSKQEDQKRFFRNIRSLAFFKEKKDDEIKSWLIENQDKSSKEYDLGNRDGDEIVFIELPNNFAETKDDARIFDDATQERLIDKPVTFDELDGMLKEVDVKVLTMKNKFWRVMPMPEILEERDFSGWTVELAPRSRDSGSLLVLDQIPDLSGQVGFYLGESSASVSFSGLEKEHHFDSEETVVTLSKGILKRLPPSALKSLLQKLIRYRPRRVLVDSETSIAAKDLLFLVCLFLAKHPGTFNPTTRNFNSGLESFCKRLAVIAVEDSCPTTEEQVASAMWGAYLSRRIKRWVPPHKLMQQWLEFAMELYDTERVIDFRREVGEGTKLDRLSSSSEPLEQCAHLLEEHFLGGMEGDRYMFRDLAKNFRDRIRTNPSSFRPDDMPIYHCVDQHWATSLAYLLPAEFVASAYEEAREVSPASPFLPVFSKVFNQLTGLNPRRKDNFQREFDRDRDIPVIRTGQKLYWELYLKEVETIDLDGKLTERKESISNRLHPSWLSGLIGEIPSSLPNVVGCLRVDDLSEPVPIKKISSRSKEDPSLSPENEERVIRETREKLERGVPFLTEVAPSDEFLGQEAYFDPKDKTFYVRPRGSTRNGTAWKDFLTVKRDYPLYPSSDCHLDSPFKAYLLSGRGIHHRHQEHLHRCLEKYTSQQLQYCLRYLDGFDLTIKMPKVSREGKGDPESIDIKLVSANQLLLQLSLIYPGIIGASRIATFAIKHLPSYRWIVDQVRQYLNQEKSLFSDQWGEQFRDSKMIDGRPREPMTHQRESLEKMVRTHRRAIKGHFIWIPVGMGKTYIALSYLQHLKEIGNLPSYVIYTLPKSAIKTVLEEILTFGVKINYLDRTLGQTNLKEHLKKDPSLSSNPLFLTRPRSDRRPHCDPLPNCINLIDHEQVKNCREELQQIASNSVFIVDEVHNAMPRKGKESQKAANIMLLARLSYEFIGMTGTAIVDNNIYQLMPWMKLVVPYTVKRENYFSSLTAMIARKVNTGHRIHPEEIEIGDESWPPELLERFRELAPPELGGRNPAKSYKRMIKATELCYEVTDLFLVGRTLQFVVFGIGVMLVAMNRKHQQKLTNLLLHYGFDPRDILVLGGDGATAGVDFQPSINLTQDNVESGKVKPYRVVVVRKDTCEGYSLTYLRAMVQAPYPSNQSKRDQLAGRINRLEPNIEKHLYYCTIHTKITTLMLKYHGQAANLRDFYEQMAKKIEGFGPQSELEVIDTDHVTLSSEKLTKWEEAVNLPLPKSIGKNECEMISSTERRLKRARDKTEKDALLKKMKSYDQRLNRTKDESKREEIRKEMRDDDWREMLAKGKADLDWQDLARIQRCLCDPYRLDPSENPLTGDDTRKTLEEWIEKWCQEGKEVIVEGVKLKRELYERLVRELSQLDRERLEILINCNSPRAVSRNAYLEHVETMKAILPDRLEIDPARRTLFRKEMMRRALARKEARSKTGLRLQEGIEE